MSNLKTPTHTFKLLSGVEAEVEPLMGVHQRILTQRKKGQSHSDRMNELLASVLVRVGTKVLRNYGAEERKDFVSRMLSEDRRMALLQTRQFSLGFPEEFELMFKWTDSKNREVVDPMLIPIPGGEFPTKPMSVQYAEYSDIEREFETVLPQSGLRIKYKLSDGISENFVSNTKPDEISSHTALRMRNPRFFAPKEEGSEEGTWIALDLDRTSLLDLTHLRTEIREREGKVDTEVKFEHPGWRTDEADEKFAVVDLLNTLDFFFPSGAI
jgi:hypothetical protein